MDAWLEDQWLAAENEVLSILQTSGATERHRETLPLSIRQLIALVLSIGTRCDHAVSNKPPVPWVVDTHDLKVTCLNCVKNDLVISEMEQEFEKKKRRVNDHDMAGPPTCDVCSSDKDIILAILGVGITVVVLQVCQICWTEVGNDVPTVN